MRKQMEIEDGILDDFEDMQRRIQRQSHEIAEAERLADEARRETAEAKRKIDEVKREADESKKTVARNLKAARIALTTIMQATGLSREEVENA